MNTKNDPTGTFPDNSTSTPSAKYSEYYTRLKRVIIPLTNYHMFHKVSDIDNDNPNFIERSGTTERLKKWLSDDGGNSSGSYLITGYRGMGKSSFVGKVVHSLEREARNSGMGSRRSEQNQKGGTDLKKVDSSYKILYSAIYFIGGLIPLIFLSISMNILCIITFSILLFGILVHCSRYYKSKPQRFIHYIKINIGNEIHDERDILAILSTSIADKVRKYIHRELLFRPSYFPVFFLKVFFFSLCMSGIYFEFDKMIGPLFAEFQYSIGDGFFTTLVTAVGRVFICSDEWWAIFVKLLLSALVSYALCFKLFEPLILRFMQLFQITLENPHKVLRRLESLIDRIDSSMDEDTNSNIPASTFFSINLGAHRSKKYQQASVREIEYDLSQIINDFQQSYLLNNRFIIVLDELDKLDISENKGQNSEKTGNTEDSPSFSFEDFPSDTNASTYDRQHNILMFLGRLKYFTTNAKAKFVFIAGHELYDAYLADVSDREYAISSMFNGVLNLNSFLSSKPQYKNIGRMTESYLCKALVNLEYLKRGENGKSALDIARQKLDEKKKDIEEEGNKSSDNIKKSKIEKDKERIEDRIRKLEEGELLNDGGDDAIYTLKNVAEEFRTIYCENFRDCSDEQWESIFHFLQQFVTYLTLTSNGAPKKLISQIEKYVISKEQYDHLHQYADEKGDFAFFFGDGINAEYYLSFGYYDKERIGFIHYIAQPIFSSIINSNSDYDDKLLVTSMFLVSHLYKHHGSGFSWRNLEYIPELIESNKTPELRGYIKDILITMEKMDLTSITSGVYNFKFSKRLIEEISHFSRKFEEVSAIFNFSHDYFRAVKRYYRGLLSFYGSEKNGKNFSQVVSANIYSYLGDIQMAGEEYTEAASTFRIAADLFKKTITEVMQDKNSNDDISLLIVRYTYAMLKLGLAYEKRSTFDSAYLVYNSLTNSLIDIRHIDDHIFGLKTGIVYNRSEGGSEVHKVILYEPTVDNYEPYSGKKNGEVSLLPHYLDDNTETGKLKTWVYGDELFSNLYFYLTPEKEQILSKLTAYEDLRIAYLSILAKLFALEKQNMSGITRENVELAVSEFEYMYIITKMSSKYILAADFYRKLGDILYYKNQNYYKKWSWENMFLVIANGFNVKHLLMTYMFKSKLTKSTVSNVIEWFRSDDPEAKEIITSSKELTPEDFITRFTTLFNDKINKKTEMDFKDRFYLSSISINKVNKMCMQRSMEIDSDDHCHKKSSSNIQRPCVACRFYNKSLYTIYDHIKRNIHKEEHTELSTDYKKSQTLFFLKITKSDIFKSFRANELKQMALTLEAMGNTMLSCADNTISLRLISEIINYTYSDKNERLAEIGRLSNLDRAVIYNITASKYYEKASEYSLMTECLRKVMQILYKYIEFSVSADLSSQIKLMFSLKKSLVRMIHLIFESKNYHITDIKKFRQIVHSLDKTDNFVMLGMSSMMAEIQDLIYDYYKFRLILSTKFSGQKVLTNTIKTLYNAPSLRCYNNMSLASNRLSDYLFKSYLNNIVYEEGFESKKDDKFSKEMSSFLKLDNSRATPENSLKVFLIADSIFCLTTTASILSTTRTNTILSNISYTEIYIQLIKWVTRKEDLSKDNNEEMRNYLNRQIELVIPDTSIETINKSYYQKLAESHYHQALQMHTEGSAYHNMIDRFYILDDDLQNNTSQFLLALERYSLRTHDYQNELKNLSRKSDTESQPHHSYYDIHDYISNPQLHPSSSNA